MQLAQRQSEMAHSCFNRRPPLPGTGTATNRPRANSKACSPAQRKCHVLRCRAVTELTAPSTHPELAPSCNSTYIKDATVLDTSAAASQVAVLGQPSSGCKRQCEASSTPIRSSSEALQLAITSMGATKNLYSYLAEYAQSQVVQQQVQAVLDSQEQLVAYLRQLQQQETAAAHETPVLASLSSSSTSSAPTAVNSRSYPVVLKTEGDVFEASHGFQSGCLSLNSPTSSVDDPVTQQLTAVWAGVAAGRGHRRYMEDCSAIHSLHPQQGVQHHSQHSTDNTLFAGVYDGHGGRSTAAYAAAQLPTVLHKELRRRGSSSSSSVDKHQVFSSAFHELDSSWAAHGHVEQSGSTAVTAMINKNNLVVANAGDSVAVLARGGSSQRLSRAHKLCCPHELARVTAAGGQVTADSAGKPRLMQSEARWQRYVAPMTLAVTRGFGDFGFKGMGGDLVIPTPFVSELQLSPADQLLLLTSDGITDVLGDDSMMEVALDALAKARNTTDDGSELASAAAAAVKETAAATGAWDNMTVVALLLDWNK